MENQYFLTILEAIPKEIQKNGKRFNLTISFYPHPVFSYIAEDGETYGVLRATTLKEALSQTVRYLVEIGAMEKGRTAAYLVDHEPRHIGETEEYIERMRHESKNG